MSYQKVPAEDDGLHRYEFTVPAQNANERDEVFIIESETPLTEAQFKEQTELYTEQRLASRAAPTASPSSKAPAMATPMARPALTSAAQPSLRLNESPATAVVSAPAAPSADSGKEIWEVNFALTLKRPRSDFANDSEFVFDVTALKEKIREKLFSATNPACLLLDKSSVAKIFKSRHANDPNKAQHSIVEKNSRIQLRTLNVMMSSNVGRTVSLIGATEWLNTTTLNGQPVMAYLVCEDGKTAQHTLPIPVIDYRTRVLSSVYQHFGSIDPESLILSDVIIDEEWSTETPPTLLGARAFVADGSKTYSILVDLHATDPASYPVDYKNAKRETRDYRQGQMGFIEIDEAFLRTTLKSLKDITDKVHVMNAYEDFKFIISINEPAAVLASMGEKHLGSLAGINPLSERDAAASKLLSVTCDFNVSFVVLDKQDAQPNIVSRPSTVIRRVDAKKVVSRIFSNDK